MTAHISIAEVLRLDEAATKGPWCAVLCPDGTDPEDYHYGWGELRTQPTETGGWELIVKVDAHDEHDDDLRFMEMAKSAAPELAKDLERLVKLIRDSRDFHGADIEGITGQLAAKWSIP